MLTAVIVGAVAGIATVTFIFESLSTRTKIKFLNMGVYLELIFMFLPFLIGFISASQTTAVIGIVSGITMSLTTYKLKKQKHKYLELYIHEKLNPIK